MSKVQLVPNAKASKLAGHPVYYVPSTNGKWSRLQVAHKGFNIRNGFETSSNMTGFLYVQGEDRAKEYVQAALADNMSIAGKVIYVDQLEPINTEAVDYGKQYPYPFRYGKTELSVEQRQSIQAACIAKGLTLQQSGKTIYRRKVYTNDLTAVSVVLSPDNLDEVNNFIGTLLSGAGNAKAARFAELKAMTKAARTAAGVQAEYAALLAEQE